MEQNYCIKYHLEAVVAGRSKSLESKPKVKKTKPAVPAKIYTTDDKTTSEWVKMARKPRGLSTRLKSENVYRRQKIASPQC